ncbi:TetR/AcrR family transcriptional regulator [Sporosarcina sp. BI001-red]|uniref:TetR family transcriptional regulator n=1 Tax=Sporosarcina sp. BI001-red TaxID=2282866 RepID=UPI000E279C8F|nr:TetR family transcriptional regulator [Sporosarcina sp. BI001-red]REB06446.1 TetR/AcrR family transcriptional regulator [Sporosarcina sp. BI001-red]
MNKKERIVQSAIQVFTEKGVEKTTVSHIVKVAGIAQGTFYLYFPSKLALMPAIAEVMVQLTLKSVIKAVEESASFDEQLKQFVDAIFAVSEEHHEIQAMIYSGLASTEHLKEWESVYAPMYQWVSSIVAKGQEQGAIRGDSHPDQLAKLIIGLTESAAEQIYLYDEEIDQEIRASEQKRETLLFLTNALGYSKQVKRK